ncbi:phosphatase PAP2 family protein [Aquisediminimonas profunda]|uniref:phosphatase PAP2 family protein n=1 Tax=Aquisediminimonas profunda TaxID=1550733 RepID=UPI001C6370D7|nr:phosphatase PAP2 family protein [Aquisediminimonas profunda]
MTENGAADVTDGRDSPAKPISGRLGILLLVLALALGLLVSFGVGQQADRTILKALAFRQNVTSDVLIAAAQWVTWAGAAGQRTFAMVVCAGWLLWRKRPYPALVMLVAPPLAGATSSILKEAFGRARPDVVPHLDLVTNLSFPSGHATNVMATLLLASLLLAKKRRHAWVALALVGAAAIGASRVLLGVHWPSDVIGGWFWGAGIALLALSVTQRLEGRQNANLSPILMSRPESGA